MRQRLPFILSCLALLVSLLGFTPAVQAVERLVIPKDAVTSKQVKDGSLKRKDFADGQLPRGPQGEQGPAGPAGPAAASLWATVAASGKLLRGENVTEASGGEGFSWYTVRFTRDVRGCGFAVTIASDDPSKVTTGQAYATTGGQFDARAVRVYTFTSSGQPTLLPFHVAAFCAA